MFGPFQKGVRHSPSTLGGKQQKTRKVIRALVTLLDTYTSIPIIDVKIRMYASSDGIRPTGVLQIHIIILNTLGLISVRVLFCEQ